MVFFVFFSLFRGGLSLSISMRRREMEVPKESVPRKHRLVHGGDDMESRFELRRKESVICFFQGRYAYVSMSIANNYI